MRTTITLDDDLFRQLEQLAGRAGASFKQVVNDTLRRGLGTPGRAARQQPYRVEPIKSGLLPGVDPLRLNQLLDELEVEDFIRESGKKP